MKPEIGISDKNLKSVTGLLSTILSGAMVLYVKTRKFHWNVYGDSFMEFHLLFEEQYTALEKSIDEIAERINKLGAKTIGTMAEFIEQSPLKETPGKYPTSMEMVKELLKDHETVIKALRDGAEKCDEEYKDAGTADFLIDLMKEHETMAWKLRRYLK